MKRTINKKITFILLSIIFACFLFAVLNPVKKAKADDPEYFVSESGISVVSNSKDTIGNEGVDISLSGIKGQDYASFEYKNYIETSVLEKGFLTLGVKPSAAGETDYDYMLVTLTDALNEKSKLVYAIAPQPESCGTWRRYVASWASFTDDLRSGINTDSFNNAVLTVRGTRQNIVGINTFISSANNKYEGYYQDCGRLIGDKNRYFVKDEDSSSLNALTFSFDGSLMKINGTTVADVSDPRFLNKSAQYLASTEYKDVYSVDYVSDLFSSGYVTLKITYLSIYSDSITCNVSQIGGQKIADNEGCDIKAASPLINCDFITNGIKGLDYKIPQTYAYDLIDGDLSDSVNVRITGPDGLVPANGDGTFTMETAGNYKVTYIVSNKRGNVFEKDYGFVCYEEVPLTKYGNGLNFKTDYVVGDSISVTDISAGNAISVREDGSVLVRKMIQADGKIVKVIGDDVDYVFEKEGNYAVIYRYENEFGYSDSVFKTFKVARTIRISPDIIPLSLRAGRANTVADFKVENYVNDIRNEDIYRAAYLNDTLFFKAKGNTTIYGSLSIPADLLTAKGTAKLTYRAGFGENDLPYANDYKIPVISPRYMSDFIIPYNSDGEYDDNGIAREDAESGVYFKVTGDKGLMLPQPIADNKTLISFGISTDSEFGTMKVIFEDYARQSKKMIYTVSRIGSNKLNITVNGQSYPVEVGVVDGVLRCSWNFDGDSGALRNEYKEIIAGKQTTWSDGSVYDRFEKGVYVLKFEFSDAANAGLLVSQISNQSFASVLYGDEVVNFTDTQAPIIVCENDMNGQKAQFGRKFRVSAAKAYDVLDNETTINVSVTDPDGKTLFERVSCEKAFDIILTSFGKYTVTYVAQDSVGIFSARQMYTLSVNDEEAPYVHVFGELPTEVQGGMTLTLPTATATDNVTKNLPVWIIAVLPDGERRVLNAEWNDVKNDYTFIKDVKFTFEEKGEFRIIYYAVDENYNFTEKTFVITVR